MVSPRTCLSPTAIVACPKSGFRQNEPFDDIYDIWLAGDDYKYRLMRSYGVDESCITRDKSRKGKFIAYCTAIGTAFGDPFYHWSQLERKEFFHCEVEINAQNAERIWDGGNVHIALNKIARSNVSHIFITNKFFGGLTAFTQIEKKDRSFKVISAFRADEKLSGASRAGPFLQQCDEISEHGIKTEKKFFNGRLSRGPFLRKKW